MAEIYTIHKTKRVITFPAQPNAVDSCWPSNWTVNLVDESAFWSEFAGPERRLVDCDPLTNKFSPILYLNDRL